MCVFCPEGSFIPLCRCHVVVVVILSLTLTRQRGVRHLRHAADGFQRRVERAERGGDPAGFYPAGGPHVPRETHSRLRLALQELRVHCRHRACGRRSLSRRGLVVVSLSLSLSLSSLSLSLSGAPADPPQLALRYATSNSLATCGVLPLGMYY